MKIAALLKEDSLCAYVQGKKTLHRDSKQQKLLKKTAKSAYCIELSTNLLLYAPIIFRQVGTNVPITGSRIREVKGRGVV